MDSKLLDEFNDRIVERLRIFGDSFRRNQASLQSSTGDSRNDSFLLRAWLSLTKDVQGDEVVVSVDGQWKGRLFVVTSDICEDEGTLLASGPTFRVNELSEDILEKWFTEFDSFLDQHGRVVEAAVDRLD